MFLRVFAVLTLLIAAGCSEPAFRLHEKLEECLQDDLKVMVAEVVKGSGKQHLLDEPYFTVVDIKFFEGDTAKIYAGYAEVDFFYYRDIAIHQKRKYRYDARRNYWDRYFKKLVFSKEQGIGNSETKELEK